MIATLHVVVVGVLGHPPVEEGPCEIVHGVLFVLNGLCHNLGVEMVMKTMVEMTLYRERLIQELLEEILLCCLTEQHALSIRVLRQPIVRMRWFVFVGLVKVGRVNKNNIIDRTEQY